LQLFVGDQEIELKSHERSLLKTFVEHPNTVLTRADLLSLLGDPFGDRFERSIDVRVARLRDGLRQHDSRHQHIVTVRGQGYRFSP
jgi:two-component system phosphate regulon response regulator OmpR